MTLDLSTPVSQINRVGKTTSSRLKKLNIETVYDLIFYYPFRWEDLSNVVSIFDLVPGDPVTIKCTIDSLSSRRSANKRMNLTQATVSDETGSIQVIWFNQPYIAKTLSEGDVVYLSGKADVNRGSLQFSNPTFEKVSLNTTNTARIVPIYSLTSNLTQKQLRFLIKSVIALTDRVEDFLPQEIVEKYNLLDLSNALKQIHFPDSSEKLKQAADRLKFNELFLFQLQILLSKAALSDSKALSIKFHEAQTKKFVESLPFTLTADQKKSAWTIISDLEKDRPMNRLLEGDVGSGKTVVASLAMLNTALNGMQSVLMAPTEILASQHYKTVLELFKDSDKNTCLFTRTQKFINEEKVSKKKALEAIKSGHCKIIIGTHALIQDDIAFNNLALSIIDEQHRFGVNQRKTLKEKSGDASTVPHLLSMTATPIPRSLALALYGDLDLSILREMPKERKKIITKVVDASAREDTYKFIRKEVKAGHQIFVVCPLVDPSDKLGVKSVTEEYDRLSKEVFPDLKIAMIHGKLKSSDKENIMTDFLNKKSDLLVSTSVIEVGVNIPNATVMMIEGSERFGLAQLHQFRGRVGRSSFQSHCFLLSDNKSFRTKERLNALVDSQDGFELAEKDLKFRGPGAIYGEVQSGYPEFKIAKLTDSELILQAKKTAQEILELSADLSDYPELKQKANLARAHLE